MELTENGELFTQDQLSAIGIFTMLEEYAHKMAKGKGFWDKDEHPAVYIALMHSELSECLDAIREAENPMDSATWPAAEKINPMVFKHAEEELADTVIRILDFCGAHKLALGAAIIAKMEYNAGRPYKHGKSF